MLKIVEVPVMPNAAGGSLLDEIVRDVPADGEPAYDADDTDATPDTPEIASGDGHDRNSRGAN